jgi:hypothetical protein
MSEARLTRVVDRLIRHWRGDAEGGASARQSCQLLAQRITRTLPPELAAQVQAAPEDHRETIEIALGRLEERDPGTRDLLRPLTEETHPVVDQTKCGAPSSRAPLAGADMAVPFAGGGPTFFNQVSGVQAGTFSGIIGSGNSIGAGSVIGAGNAGGAGNLSGSGNITGNTLGAAATLASGSQVGAPAAQETGSSPPPRESSAVLSAPITILFVGANPVDGARLRLDEEVREIDSALRQGSLRDRFDLKQHHAVRMLDLQQALLLYHPQILHFSGHGSSAHAIYLESDSAASLPVTGSVLAKLLALFSKHLRCVVLNACYSEDQAQAVAQYVECVVGMTTAVGDQSAIRFAAAFYQALAYGTDVQTAFDLGCVHIQPSSPEEGSTPRLVALRRKASEIVLAQSN